MVPESLIKILKIKNRTQDFHQEFYEIAKQLFTNFVIVKDRSTRYRLTELEFYYLSAFHEDIYIYKNIKQMTMAQCYRHGVGIDLTFGNTDANIYGGILIRGLWDITKEKYINGCWNVLKNLSNEYTKISSEDLQRIISVEESSNNIGIILSSTRVGLKKKSLDTDNYISRNYRFITDICPWNKFKEKTIVAEKALESKVLDKEAINNLFTWKILK